MDREKMIAALLEQIERLDAEELRLLLLVAIKIHKE